MKTMPSHLVTRLLAAARCSPVAVVIACSGGENKPGGNAGLATVFDSTADTIIARVEGQVPVSSLRTMTAMMQIAPSIDDTSLFAQISEIDVDQANRIWVFDFQSSQLFLFDSTGALVRRIGRRGQGPGEFASGGGLVILPDTGAAVWDSRNSRISFFTAAGDFRTSWPTPAGFSTSNALYIDTSGTLYLRRPVTPPREGEILGRMGLVPLKDGGEFADSLLPVDLPVTRDTYVAVSPDGSGRSSTGSSFAPNYYWDWHPDGYFVAGHGGRYEIIIERPGAKPVVIRRIATPVPITADERDEEKEFITWNMRQTQPSWSWTAGALPDTKAPLTGITVTRDGNIWARVAVPSELIPENELQPRREKGPPVRKFRGTGAIYEVFAPNGRFLGRVPMPPRTTMFQADGDYFWGISRNEDDLPSVVRFRLNRPFDSP
jgi:hypothetical protein